MSELSTLSNRLDGVAAVIKMVSEILDAEHRNEIVTFARRS